MEIERKFLLDAFPAHLPLVKQADMAQGYISVGPVVRIRSEKMTENTNYVLCFKGPGTIAREEIEINLDESVFHQLEGLLKAPLIRKEFRVYQLPDGHHLECNHVDKGEPTEFYYAEVEFESLEEALAFEPPSFLGADVTEDRSYGMAAYWVRKVRSLTGKS